MFSKRKYLFAIHTKPIQTKNSFTYNDNSNQYLNLSKLSQISTTSKSPNHNIIPSFQPKITCSSVKNVSQFLNCQNSSRSLFSLKKLITNVNEKKAATTELAELADDSELYGMIFQNTALNSAFKLNDKRNFKAKLIGTDPTTDIALIKIEADGLKPLHFANSDGVKVGEWVLAVGNPFNLTSTVTAGIVSAKGRHVGINTSNMAIESFIQTDAAVNPGNSGGALVNTRGEVIGINTAIASPTGSFSGYSFAVPSNIAQKVAQDLMTYGEVQRALLGVTIGEVDASMVKDLGLDKPCGVVVASVSDGGAAKEAGVKERDVITKLDDEEVNSVPDLQSRVAQHRPGDSIKLTIIRDGKTVELVATLRNIRGTTGVVKGADTLLRSTSSLAKMPDS